MEITCPSGLSGRIRGFKVKDEKILSDPAAARDGRVVTKLLTSCWLETTNPGPYPFLGNGDGYKSPGWGKILQGDRLYALIQMRIKTYGPEYEFDVQCQNASCNGTIEWRMDLNDLECMPLSEDSRAKIRNGESFEAELTDGTLIKYRLLTGDDDRFMAKFKSNNAGEMLLGLLARRIVEIDGVGADRRKIAAFVDDMEAMDADRLRDELEDADCGIQTQFDVFCTACAYDQPVSLPLSMAFFSSRKRFSRSRRNVGGS